MNKSYAIKSSLLPINLYLLNQKNIFKYTILKINYSFLLLSLSTIHIINFLSNQFFIKSIFFKINKNNFNFERLIKKNNFFFYRKKYIFNKNYKFNKLFLLNSITFFKNLKINKMFNSSFLFKNFKHKFFTKPISKSLSKKSFKIVGNLLSPFSWNLQNFRIKNSNSIFFTKKNRIKKFTQTSQNNPVTVLNSYYKKTLLANFFYINKSFLNNKTLNNLKILYFIKSKLKRKNNKLFYKPYSFFNNTSLFKNQHSLLKTFYNNFKKLSKIFNLFKKINFKNKNKNRLKFSNLVFSQSRRLYLSNKSSNFFLNINIFNFFSKTHPQHLITHKNFNNCSKFNFSKSRYEFRIKSNFFLKKKTFTISFLKKNKISLRRFFKIKKHNILIDSLNNSFTFYKQTINLNKILLTNFYNYNPLFTFLKNYKFINNSKNLFYNSKNNSIKFYSKKQKSNSFFQIFINTKTRYKLTFGLSGFLFITNSSYVSQTKKDLMFLMKKNYYSFSQKNDMQRFILKRYLKNKFIITSDKINFLKNPNFQIFSNYNYSFSNLFSNQIKPSFSPLLINHLNNYKWITSEIDELYYNSLFSFDYVFSIKRIKFKPGYMTMWRNSRETLKTLMGLKFKYQYKLTKFITKYNKSTKIKTFLVLEFQLINIILKSKLLPDKNSIELFLNNNLIYINGKVCNNPFFSLFVNDFIQFVIHNKYYILYRWMSHWNIQKKIRLKTKTKKKLSNQSFNEDKQHSNIIPKWILQNKDIINDCARYLEVDYFTLSAFFIYEPFMWVDLNPYSLNNAKFSIMNLYNWKYIT